MAAKRSKTVIVDASDFVARVKPLYKAAKDDDDQWWTPALKFGWNNVRKSTKQGSDINCGWVTINYIDESGVTSPLYIRFADEVHVGDLRTKIEQYFDPSAADKKKLCVQFQKWKCFVQTEQDGSIKNDAEGKPIYPSDEYLSPYYEAAYLISCAFTSDTNIRVCKGEDLINKAIEMRKADKQCKADAILAEFIKNKGPIGPGDIVADIAGVINKNSNRLITSEIINALFRNAVSVRQTKVYHLCQTTAKVVGKDTASVEIANPLTRIAIPIKGDRLDLEVRDYEKPQIYNNRRTFELAKVDNDLVDARNLGDFITTRSKIYGVVDLSAICLSSMGISIPAKLKGAIVVEKGASYTITVDDVLSSTGPISSEQKKDDTEDFTLGQDDMNALTDYQL